MKSRSAAWLAVGIWTCLLAAGLVAAPDLVRFAITDPLRFFPPDAPSRSEAAAVERLFPGAVAASQIAFVIEAAGKGGIAAERGRVAAFADALRASLPAASIAEVLEPGANPVAEARLVSRDGRAALVIVSCRAGFASEEASALVAEAEQVAAAFFAGTPLRYSLSGHAVLGRDYLRAIDEGGARSAFATIVLVALTLLAVYRAPVAVAISLATLGAALGVAAGAVALLARMGLPVAYPSRGFLVAIVYGVGTDYCLLLFARLREERAGGAAGDALRRARRASAPVLAVSAGAVALACALMGAARFGLFAYSGPGLAVGVGVALAAVLTLAPALMRLVGPALFWPNAGAPARESRLWHAIARGVLARPVLAGLATALALAPLAQGGLRAAPSFELELDLPESSVSEAGFAALVRSFEASAVQTLTLAVEAGAGAPELRSTAGLDALHALAEWLAAQPAIARVYGATRPTGEAGLLARGSLGSQLHELATGLARAEDGARELAGGIAAAERGVRTGRTEIAREREKLESEQRASLLGVFAPGRFEDAEQGLAGMESKLGELEAGLARAALGADALRAGIGRGRERLAAVTAAPGAAALLARPLLTPDDLSANAELGRALAYYLSEDSRAARFELVLADPPNSPAAVAALARLRSELQVLLPALGFGRAHFAGATPITLDLAALTQRDLATLSIWIALGIFALLVLLLRELAAPAAITALILLSYFAALGALDFAVRAGLWPGLDWKAPFFLFVLLVAIGADYGVFVLGRAREERRAQEFEPALVGALVATGPVVTSCGVVLAGTFAALTLSRIAFLEQVGLGITVGVLIDTGLVRPFLLPAVAIGLERARSR